MSAASVVRATTVRAVVAAALWWVLVEGQSQYLAYGLIAVPAAVAASLWLAPPRSPRPVSPAGPRAGTDRRPATGLRTGWPSRAGGLVRLVGWYAANVVRGAIDVAGRVLRSPVDADPVVVRTTTRLPAGASRQAAVAMYGLMPGSLVADTDGETLWLHSLSADLGPEDQWRRLEEHVAAVAGMRLDDG